MTNRTAIISSDIDTLESIYRGQGCRRPQGYTYAEFAQGLENFSRFLERYNANATLFMVGRDFLRPQHQSVILEMVRRSDEIANHTHTHPQGFRFLNAADKERELAQMEEACLAVTGRKPIGFRSPGWNISDDLLPILKRRGYRYDSSVFPTFLMPLLKLLHWRTMSKRGSSERTTMGQLYYMFAPTQPYQTTDYALGKQGSTNFWEFPVTVTPIVRIPFFATFLLSTGLTIFELSYRMLKSAGFSIQFQFHLSDFVDYKSHLLEDQVPELGRGQYVPKALLTPLDRKLSLFQRAMDMIAENYTFSTIETYVTSNAVQGSINHL